MKTIYLALGSNIGQRAFHIRSAIKAMRSGGIKIEKISPFLETEPVGGPPQDKFLNAVLKGETSLTPLQLLSFVKSIEKRLGRKRTVRYGPRIIDIDILLYEDVQCETNRLTIPHPRMLERDFVLKPLRKINPALVRKLLKHARHS